MAKEKDNKKEKRKTVEERQEELKKSIEESLTESLKVDLKNHIDENMKKELKIYVDDEIKNELKETIEYSYKRIIREKNFKILRKNIIIILLIAIILYLSYTLYKMDFFSQFFVKEKNNNSSIEQKITNQESQETEEVSKPTLEDLKKKYDYLLKDIKISEGCAYLEEFYHGTITDEMKNYIVLNNLDFNELITEEDYEEIEEEVFQKAYEKIWKDGYKPISFDYNGNKIRYISKLKSYLSETKLEKNTNMIQRAIIDIIEDNQIIKLTTIEGIIKEDTIQNPMTKEEYPKDKEDILENYQDQLVKVTYVFQNEKLERIEKENIENGI